jgi:hypothetical protein
MGLLDFFKFGNGETVPTDHTAKFDEILQQMLTEASERKESPYSIFTAYASLNSFKSLVKEKEEFRQHFLFYLYDVIKKSWREYKKTGRYSRDSTWYQGLKLITALFKVTELCDEDLLRTARTFKQFKEIGIQEYDRSLMPVLDAVEAAVRKRGLTPVLRQTLETLKHPTQPYSAREQEKENERIIFLLQGDPHMELSEHDRWGKGVIAFVRGTNNDTRTAWLKLFALAKKEGTKSMPSQKWLKQAQPMVIALGHEHFANKMKEWLAMLKETLQEIHKPKGHHNFLRDENHEIVKGLIWCSGFVNDPSLNTALDEYAGWAYKKKPGVGPISAKTGTATMFAFSLLPVKEGVSRLSKFRMKIKNNTILKSIDKIIRSVAEKNEMAIDEMEELSVPDFGVIGQKYAMQLGDSRAVYDLFNGEIKWERAGKFQKSAPTEVKEKFVNELKLFKNNVKEIDALLPVIKNRLEQGYLKQRSWTFPNWIALYHHHPLTALVADKLIWHFGKGDIKEQGIWMGDNFVNIKGEVISWLDQDVSVQLWHPIGFTSEQILAWRNFLRANNIVQPFKQAYREVYIITDAELRTETYSNRFAAHILRQHQFAALCRQRGWHYQLMGDWDSHNTPYVVLSQWGITAEFYVNSDWQDTDGNTNAMGIFNYITTDQVRFGRDGAPMQLFDVPALLFSEIMRDVDLFVGVTSIGNDAAWQDGGDNLQNTYWRDYSFSDLSESAKIRSQVLETLIPSLKIASQCSFDKKFLTVKGKLRTYKIHMGSGNILMEPDDQYLCIVPEGKRNTKEKVFLPFEGDGILSIIISKAFLLAADDKITDVTITRQIKRR